QIADGLGRFAKHLVVGRGDVGRAEQVLAEDLAAFQFGGGAAGAEDSQPGRLEGIDDAGGQRSFGADDVKPTLFSLANAISAGKSSIAIGTFSPSMSVPALPGATKTRSAL